MDHSVEIEILKKTPVEICVEGSAFQRLPQAIQ